MKRLLFTSALGLSAASVALFCPLPLPVPEGPAYQELPKVPFPAHPNKHAISQVPRTIGVIGGGSSGLITAKVLKQQGYSVEVLEKREKYGGVWFNNYEGAGLQVPYPTYDMPDHYFPAGTPMLPKQDVILKFFDRYVSDFKLMENLRFNSEVRDVHQLPDDTWEVTLSTGEKKTYDFLVLCTGPYHVPNIPHFPGLDSFQGKVLHSSQLQDGGVVCAGKRVVVIGGGKSATDILQVAADYALSTTGLMRTIHYSLPVGFQMFGLHVGYLMYNRFADLLAAPAYCESGWANALLRPIGDLYWSYMGKKISEDLPFSARPTITFREDRERQAISREADFTRKVNEGKIVIKHGEIDHVQAEGVRTKDRKDIDADVLIFATGFKRQYFGLHQEEGEQWRYRGIILPGVRNYAVIGNVATTRTMVLSNLQAVWLAEMLRGKVRLPSDEEMKRDIEKRKEYMKKTVKSPKISFLMKDDVCADQLVGDMGLQTRREKTWFDYWFGMTHPSVYRSVLTHRV